MKGGNIYVKVSFFQNSDVSADFLSVFITLIESFIKIENCFIHWGTKSSSIILIIPCNFKIFLTNFAYMKKPDYFRLTCATPHCDC